MIFFYNSMAKLNHPIRLFLLKEFNKIYYYFFRVSAKLYQMGNQLSREQLIQRIQQQAFSIYNLELREIRTQFAGYTQNNAFTDEKDPQGYFRTMMMDPDTSEDVFESILKKHYQILAINLHPDKGGNEAEFKEMKNAYDFLLEPDNRKIYGKRNAFSSGLNYSQR